MAKPKERHLLEAALQNIEVAVDAITSDSAIAAIPVVGTAFKVCKGIDDIRARAFMAKLERFVSEPSLQTAAAKEAIARKVSTSPEEAQRVGETVFLVLERFIDLDKPELLAKLFVAYLDDVVSATDLQRLAQAIDIAFAGDLKELVCCSEQLIMGNPISNEGIHWKRMLVPSGLTVNNAGGVMVVKVTCDVSPLGQMLWKACQHVAKRL